MQLTELRFGEIETQKIAAHRIATCRISDAARQKIQASLLFLLSPFTIFSEDRMRLGIKIQASLLFLLSPFTIFSEDRMRLGIKIQASL
ncbi:MAG: hypothetical protein J6Q26_09745, partial [Bacteroidales bacterium]|nr:hypothetical protein [Bacteroidales bacterium]